MNQSVDITKPKVEMRGFGSAFRCHFCGTIRPEGSIATIYWTGNIFIAIACSWHPICKAFEQDGKMCQNHEEGIEGECNSVPL